MTIIKRCWVILLLAGCLYSIVFVTTVARYTIFAISDAYSLLQEDESLPMKKLFQIDYPVNENSQNIRRFLRRHEDAKSFLEHVLMLSSSLRNQIPIMNLELGFVFRQFEAVNEISYELLNLLDQYDQSGIESVINIRSGNGLGNFQDKLKDLEEIQKFCSTLEGFLIQIEQQNYELSKFGLTPMYARKFASTNLVQLGELGDVALGICELGEIISSTVPLVQDYQDWLSNIQDGSVDGDLYLPNSLSEDLYLMTHKSLLIKNKVARIRALSGTRYLPAGMVDLMGLGSDTFYSVTNLLENMQQYAKQVSTLEESSLVKMKMLLDGVESNKSLISETLVNLKELIDRMSSDEQLSKIEFMDRGNSELKDIVETAEHLYLLATNYQRILGVGSPTKFMILGHSSDELRATGGFVSAIWVLTVQNAEIVELTYYDVGNVDDLGKRDKYPSPPPDLEEHMGAWVWLMRDVSWDPDFKNTAKDAMKMFALSKEIEVDGVVAVNQLALLSLARALSKNIDRENVLDLDYATLMSRLESTTDQHGRSYVHVVMKEILDQVLQLDDLDATKDLFKTSYDILNSKEIMLYMEDVKIQQLVEELDWGGRMDTPSGDYLFVIDSNVGWSKSDRNIQRGMKYVLDVRQLNAPVASLSLTYHNHSGEGAAPCEPQWIRRGNNYTEQLNQCYWNFFRIYIPDGSNVIELPELPLPTYSLSAVKGTGVPGSETVKIVTEHGFSVISGLAVVDSGERRTLDFKYTLPNGILHEDKNCFQYGLEVEKQPGVRSRYMTIEFLVPSGYDVRKDFLGQIVEINPLHYEVELNAKEHYIFNICDNGK